jgi:quercetin 2,3-dioxygenase
VHIDVRVAASRVESRGDAVVSRHSLSFGPHYDASNTRFGLLVAHNDDLLEPGGGFPEHPHRDLEIVTWVISGALRHADSTGATGVLERGSVQVLSAGSGVRHLEANASSGRTRYIQMWVLPDADGPPSHQVADVSALLAGGDFVVAASGQPGLSRGLSVRQPGAALHVARLPRSAAAPVPLPLPLPLPGVAVSLLHVFVATGRVVLTSAKGEGGGDVRLGEGDAARITGPRADLQVAALDDAEVLVWAMSAPPLAPSTSAPKELYGGEISPKPPP